MSAEEGKAGERENVTKERWKHSLDWRLMKARDMEFYDGFLYYRYITKTS
jgi:hypothetical protein